MLTLDEFNALNVTEQAEVVWKGTYLTDHGENGLIVRLYSLYNFYVEVFYDAQANKILRLRAFDALNHPGPDLAHIKFKSV